MLINGAARKLRSPVCVKTAAHLMRGAPLFFLLRGNDCQNDNAVRGQPNNITPFWGGKKCHGNDKNYVLLPPT